MAFVGTPPTAGEILNRDRTEYTKFAFYTGSSSGPLPQPARAIMAFVADVLQVKDASNNTVDLSTMTTAMTREAIIPIVVNEIVATTTGVLVLW